MVTVRGRTYLIALAALATVLAGCTSLGVGGTQDTSAEGPAARRTATSSPSPTSPAATPHSATPSPTATTSSPTPTRAAPTSTRRETTRPASPKRHRRSTAHVAKPAKVLRPAKPAKRVRPSKVLVIVEENEEYDSVLNGGNAPYVAKLARTYGTATNYQAGYSTGCPSLPGYLLLTSGSTHGICDDDDAYAHQFDGSSIFSQVQASGKQWRVYAESMPQACAKGNSGTYVPRHAPAPYYSSVANRCADWDVPLGTTSSGALRNGIDNGLPAFSFVAPDLCNDMHGASGCDSGRIGAGDDWLARWVPRILAGPDYRAGRLAVVITWDEGSSSSNHIPTIVISPHTRQVSSSRAFTHCSLLRTTEEILGVSRLGCAAGAASMRSTFGL
ncbi:Phosphoesterase family protein [Actinopolymorpha singaporensis]|uniref:Phosphoesterase family protein n=1 Tax=Actinopolymorpha singaporensis TaxID=117157 RepID=A0A1H1W862_9ACTN|nr:Phosphoesterase family protein [Actinopolymorpha singaporensis]